MRGSIILIMLLLVDQTHQRSGKHTDCGPARKSCLAQQFSICALPPEGGTTNAANAGLSVFGEMASLTRFVEGPLKLVVNQAKSKAAPTSSHRLGDSPRGGSHGHAQPQGVLEDECQQHRSACPDQPLAA